ncbi:hypothetical protein AAMO2058_001083300 [Amorphochlora amoebiformis]
MQYFRVAMGSAQHNQAEDAGIDPSYPRRAHHVLLPHRPLPRGQLETSMTSGPGTSSKNSRRGNANLEEMLLNVHWRRYQLDEA